MAAYKVVGPLAVILVGGKRVTRARGSLVPEGADAERVKHLLSVGLIEAVKVEDQGPKPVEKMTADELKAYAAEHEIDLGDAKNKGEVLAAIKAAEAKPADGDGGHDSAHE